MYSFYFIPEDWFDAIWQVPSEIFVKIWFILLSLLNKRSFRDFPLRFLQIKKISFHLISSKAAIVQSFAAAVGHRQNRHKIRQRSAARLFKVMSVCFKGQYSWKIFAFCQKFSIMISYERIWTYRQHPRWNLPINLEFAWCYLRDCSLSFEGHNARETNRETDWTFLLYDVYSSKAVHRGKRYVVRVGKNP